MEAKHTQGPWEFANANTVLVGPKIDDKPIWLRPVVLRAETAVRSEDAQLIAAAPDLLKALRDMLSTLMDGPDESDVARVIAQAREAIAKALPPNAKLTGEAGKEV